MQTYIIIEWKCAQSVCVNFQHTFAKIKKKTIFFLTKKKPGTTAQNY